MVEAFPFLPKDPVTLVRLNGAVQVGAGALLAVGRVPRLAALALATTLVPTTLAAHRFWELDDPQEVDLMQMAKVSAMLAQLAERRIPYIAVLTNPTTGGVSASYAMLGDAILAEPGAVIGFAGPRVIKQTLGQDLPEGFQTAEFLLDHGMLDQVVHRRDLKSTISQLLRHMSGKPAASGWSSP